MFKLTARAVKSDSVTDAPSSLCSACHYVKDSAATFEAIKDATDAPSVAFNAAKDATDAPATEFQAIKDDTEAPAANHYALKDATDAPSFAFNEAKGATDGPSAENIAITDTTETPAAAFHAIKKATDATASAKDAALTIPKDSTDFPAVSNNEVSNDSTSDPVPSSYKNMGNIDDN